MKWEYMKRSLTFYEGMTFKEELDWLNGFGADGWENYAVMERDAHTNIYYFKRQIN